MGAKNVVAMSAILCLTLAGCGQGGGGGGGEEASTLEEFMGWGMDPESEARWAEEGREREEKIAACMAKEGWEYIPVDQSQWQSSAQADIPSDPEEFREKYAYGVTTMDDIWAEPDNEFHDPNQQYVDSLSDSDRDAYYEALHGVWDESMATEDPETGEFGGESVGGCYNEIWEEERGAGEAQKLWEELDPKFQELYERMESDPRLLEATEKWSSCMQEAGYSFSSLYAPQEHLYEKLNALWENQADPFEGMTDEEIQEFWETATEEEQQSVYGGPDEAAMAELREEEIAMAAADGECRKKHIGDLEQKVREELETQFVRDNRELLEKVRDAESRG